MLQQRIHSNHWDTPTGSHIRRLDIKEQQDPDRTNPNSQPPLLGGTYSQTLDSHYSKNHVNKKIT